MEHVLSLMQEMLALPELTVQLLPSSLSSIRSLDFRTMHMPKSAAWEHAGHCRDVGGAQSRGEREGELQCRWCPGRAGRLPEGGEREGELQCRWRQQREGGEHFRA